MSSNSHLHRTDDPFNLNRFIEAQETIYSAVIRELRNGRKSTHWMWFIFPQVNGLGYSSTSKYYAIRNKEEAEQYVNHTILGARLIECSQIVLSHTGRSASEIFGSPDDLKLKSSMTLFETVVSGDSVFAQVLEKYFQGNRDTKTLKLLGRL
jgi:uncharacterized protein (DUF1810 family)